MPPGRAVLAGMADCVFCRIVAGELSAHTVFEDEVTIAFMDVGQVNPGHVIVATKPHVETIVDLDTEQAAAVFRTASRVAKAVAAEFVPDGLTILQANRPAGFQTVAHFHLHVLPRHADDGVTLTWPAKHPPAEQLAELAARIDVH
jgi:histidine triad (HIT) family protein